MNTTSPPKVNNKGNQKKARQNKLSKKSLRRVVLFQDRPTEKKNQAYVQSHSWCLTPHPPYRVESALVNMPLFTGLLIEDGEAMYSRVRWRIH